MVRIVKSVVILYAKTLLNSWHAAKALIAPSKSQPLLVPETTTRFHKFFPSTDDEGEQRKINLLKIIEKGEEFSRQTVNRYMFFNYFAFSTLSKRRKQREREQKMKIG